MEHDFSDKCRAIAYNLKRFYSGLHEAQINVERLLKENPTWTEAQIFNLLANGNGQPNTHCSGKIKESDDGITLKPISRRGRGARNRHL